MSVEFSDVNGKQWALIKDRYLEVQEKKSSILISESNKKVVKDCLNSCAHSDRCQFFSWNGKNNLCKQYKFRENKESSFQWKYDNFKYQGIELPYEVKNESHEAETQELCINYCYGDSSCIGVNFMENNKECKVFYEHSQENTYFGYNVITKNETPVAIDYSTKNVILDNEVEKPKSIGIENLIAIIIGIVLVIFAVAMFIFYRNKNKGIKEKIEEEEEEIINITSPVMSMSSPSALHVSPSTLHVAPSPLMVTPSPLIIQRSSTSPLIISPPSILPPTLPPNMPLPVIPQPALPPPTRPPPKMPLPIPPSPRYY